MTRYKKWLVQHWPLILIMGGGLVLRAVGLQFGKPFRYHPDEIKLVLQAGRLLDYQNWSRETLLGIGYYPPFFTYLLAAAYALYAAAAMALGVYRDVVAVKASYYMNPFQYHLIARTLSLIAGTLTIPLLYWIGKKLYNHRTGVIAAAFLSVVFLHVRNSHFGVVDITLTFIVLLSFACALRILQRGEVKDYLLAGLCAGLAVSTKYNSGLIAGPLIAAHLMRGNVKLKEIAVALLDKKLWLAGIITVAAFLSTCPFPFMNLTHFMGGMKGTVEFLSYGKIGSGGDFLSYFTGRTSPGFGFFYDNNFPSALGYAATLYFCLGVLYLLWRHRKEDILLLVFPLTMYLVLGSMTYKAMRHLLPIIPFLMLAAAALVDTIVEAIDEINLRATVLALLVAAVVVPQASKSFRYDLALRQPDTRTLMKEWIESRIPDGAKIAVAENGPPLLSMLHEERDLLMRSRYYERSYDLYGLVPNMYVYGGKRSAEFNPSHYIVENRIEYIVLDSFTRDKYSWHYTKERYPEVFAERQEYYLWIEGNCELLYRVTPGNDFNISPRLELYRVKVKT